MPSTAAVFISYRSADEPFAAALVDSELAAVFGPERVFRDTRTIRAGVHFPPEVREAIEHCEVLIAVIGVRWMEMGSDGRPRIHDPSDYVRQEIAQALSRGIRVIPVLVGEVDLPAAADLPDDIAPLRHRQLLRLRVRNSEYDMKHLLDELLQIIQPIRIAPPAETPPPAQPFHQTFGEVYAPGAVFGNVNGPVNNGG